MTTTRRTFLTVATAGVLTASGDARAQVQGNPASPPLPPANSVRDFGAIGDGLEHPLSERFATLAEARRAFPHAQALTDLVDGLAIQAALDHAEGNRGRVHLPAGRYRGNTLPLRLPNFVELTGDGAGISIIDNQNTRIDQPLIVNKDPDDAVNWAVRHLSLHGGSHGIRLDVTREVSGWALESVAFELQSVANFSCNKLLQFGTLDRVSFANAPYGLVVEAPTTNLVELYSVSFANHSRSSLSLRSAEAVTVTGGRIELRGNASFVRATGAIAGDVLTVAAANGHLEPGIALFGSGVAPGTRIVAALSGTGGAGTYRVSIPQSMARTDLMASWPAIDLENAGAVSFKGVYFENTHKLLLLETRSRNSVAFENCHFTGSAFTGPSDWEEVEFVSDGWVAFGGNDPNLPMRGADRMIPTGHNNDRLGGDNQLRYPGAPHSGHVVSPTRSFDRAAIDLVGFSKRSREGGASSQMLSGELALNYVGTLPGEAPRFSSVRYHIEVRAHGPGQMDASASLISRGDGEGTPPVSVRVKAGATADLLLIEAVKEQHATMLRSAVNWEFRWLAVAIDAPAALAVAIAS